METLTSWIVGELSTEARIWTALAPAILIAAYFVVGLLVYSVRCAVVGPYRDSELEARPAPPADQF